MTPRAASTSTHRPGRRRPPKAGGGGGVAGLEKRVLDRSSGAAPQLRRRRTGLQEHLSMPSRGEQGLHLGGLLGVVAGEDESFAHACSPGEAWRRPGGGREDGQRTAPLQFEQCRPPFGEVEQNVNSAREGQRCPRPCLWTSIRPPPSVITTFMSVSRSGPRRSRGRAPARLVDADRHRGDELAHRIVERACPRRPDRPARHARRRRRRRARAAVGLARRGRATIWRSPSAPRSTTAQAAPDQALDLLGAPALLALGSLARSARVRSARHPYSAVTQPWPLPRRKPGTVSRHWRFWHAGGAEFDQHRAFGVAGEAAAGEADGASWSGWRRLVAS